MDIELRPISEPTKIYVIEEDNSDNNKKLFCCIFVVIFVFILTIVLLKTLFWSDGVGAVSQYQQILLLKN